MLTDMIEARPKDIIANHFVDALVEAVEGAVVPSRALAETLIIKGSAALIAIDGRQATAQMLRQIADSIENPAPAGEA